MEVPVDPSSPFHLLETVVDDMMISFHSVLKVRGEEMLHVVNQSMDWHGPAEDIVQTRLVRVVRVHHLEHLQLHGKECTTHLRRALLLTMVR